jgi:hypothetical protein
VTRGVAVLLPLMAACSPIFLRGPGPVQPPHAYPACDDESLLPVGELLLGVIIGVAAISGAAGDGEDDTGAIAVAGGVSALYIASSIYGFRLQRRCQQRREQWKTRAPYRGFPAPDGLPGSR